MPRVLVRASAAIFSVLIPLMFLIGTHDLGWAKVVGDCENCHTMHTSEEGVSASSEALYSELVVDTCLGCHSSVDSPTHYVLGESTVPVVNYTGGDPPPQYLAGGNFWWVREDGEADDSKGHNVFLDEDDEALIDGAPGDVGIASICGTSCHENLSQPYSGFGVLNGKYGCEGCHLDVNHHAEDSVNLEGGYVNSAEQGWYRFLSGHDFIDAGVEGYEDDDWEAGHPDLPIGTVDHNEYLGDDSSGDGYGFALGRTTTAFCTGCHGRFHDEQQSDGKWIRHPSDAKLPDSGEYAGYVAYDPLTPVARPDVSGGPRTDVVPGTDMVMCLSCHRPHGSPYPDMLRWPYEEMTAGGAGVGWENKGCFTCHTTKGLGLAQE